MVDASMDTHTMKGSLIFAATALLILRIMIILWGGNHDAPEGDQLAFYSGAQQLTQSANEWIRGGGEFGYRAPMYFVFLATVFSVFPNSTFVTGQIATACIGVVNCILVFFLNRRINGTAGGWIGFWGRGLIPSFVIADTFVMSEPLFSTFLLCILLTISINPDRAHESKAIVLGVLVACCILTREVAVVYPLVFGGYLALVSKTKMEGLRCCALFGLAMIIILSPWMWRNTIVWGKPLPLSYTSGVNLHIGNNALATGKWGHLQEEEVDGLGFGTPQSDAWHREAALNYIIERPFRFLELGFKKVAWLLWPRFEREEIRELYDFTARQATLLSLLLGGCSAILITLGVVGFVLSRPDWFWCISLSLISYTIVVAFIVYGAPRYRDAMDYLLLIYAVKSIEQLRLYGKVGKIDWLISKRKVLILGVVLSYLLINWTWIALELSNQSI
ncbi:hypothetical protein FBQ96_00450 [Nitrospirales bacterium NOB]|nr:hypothetical protein [Nitrospirales bacterium NOB]